jgi:ABC-type glycerol-3-phosphate transport system substrate-binding protein
MKNLMRIGALLGATVLFGAVPALAQQKTLTVAAYGGVWDSHLRKEVFPEFEKKHGVKVEYVAGNSTDTLAKLQAQKGNQVIDVAIMDDEGRSRPGRALRYSSVQAVTRLLESTTKHYSESNDDTMKVLRRRLVQAGIYEPRAVALFFISRTALACGISRMRKPAQAEVSSSTR